MIALYRVFNWNSKFHMAKFYIKTDGGLVNGIIGEIMLFTQKNDQ